MPEYGYAWGENVGWVNFRPEEAELKIGGNILAGWARIENLGWVHFGSGKPQMGSRYTNLHGRDYGVNNDGRGRLSGWAWSETAGWISFDGVEIDAGGNFSGFAVSPNIGKIVFQANGSVESMVKTDPYPWREIGARETLVAGKGRYPAGGSVFAPCGDGGTAALTGPASFSVAVLSWVEAVVLPADSGRAIESCEAIGAGFRAGEVEARGPPAMGQLEVVVSPVFVYTQEVIGSVYF